MEMLNVHHLELFYYVAKFEGITQAVRKMPYGIQQPAVSGQILQLEEALGVRLFNRRPFALTNAGEELYDFIYPFFSRLPNMAARLRGEEAQHLKLAASSAILTSHLPALFEEMRQRIPDLRLTLRDVAPDTVEETLGRQEVDLAITILHAKVSSGIKSEELIRLPITLIVREGDKLKDFKCIQALADSSGVIDAPLVSAPTTETIVRLFQQGLEKHGLTWQPRVEVNSIDVANNYVGHGFGYGLGVDIPAIDVPDGLRRIPLPGFPPLVIGMLYQGKLKPLAALFADLVKKRASVLSKRRK